MANECAVAPVRIADQVLRADIQRANDAARQNEVVQEPDKFK